jgi:hypothetical protein
MTMFTTIKNATDSSDTLSAKNSVHYLLDFFFDAWSVSEVEELESRFTFLLFIFLLLESADVELEVELESSLLELESVELLELADVDDELLIPCIQ